MTSSITLYAVLAMILGSAGMYLMLPRGNKPGRLLGGLLGIGALGCLAMLGQCLGGLTDNVVYGVISTTAVVAAAMTVTFRSPVYCAIWFALSLLATAGIFMLQGAQFLGVATVVVYAGAILVTFLFVLMLAQPQGQAFYDRVSWEGLLSAITGVILVGVLTVTVSSVLNPKDDQQLAKLLDKETEAGKALAALELGDLHQVKLIPEYGNNYVLLVSPKTNDPTAVKAIKPALREAFEKAVTTALKAAPETKDKNVTIKIGDTSDLRLEIQPHGLPVITDEARQKNILNKEHVAKLGSQMFSKHLVAVEVAGTLLLVALVGAVAILSRDKSAKQLPNPQDSHPAN
jgi:NADH-quinone oxidoreductase subunit J